MDDLVSVIITTHNRKELLERALISVFNQTYSNIEIIVSDDCSSYDVKYQLEQLSEKYNKEIIYRKNIINRGACYTRNRAIEMSKGKFIAGLDDDDEFTSDRISLLVKNYDEKYSFVTSNTQVIDKSGSKLLFNDRNVVVNFADFMWGNNIGTQILVDKSRISNIYGFDEQLTSAQDSDMWARLLNEYGPALRLGKPTYILHTEHDLVRVSTSERKLHGLMTYNKKYESNRTNSQNKYAKLKFELWSNNKFKIEYIKYFDLKIVLYLFKKKLNKV